MKRFSVLIGRLPVAGAAMAVAVALALTLALGAGSAAMAQTAEGPVTAAEVEAAWRLAQSDEEAGLEAAWYINERDPVQGYQLHKRLADAGSHLAQWRVGMALLNGEGVQANAVLARDYVRRSAEGGDIQGEISMAVMLVNGEGGPVDEAGAREWYRRAAVRPERSSAHAMRGLAVMYLLGQGGDAEIERGIAYARLSAEAGDSLARQLYSQLGSFIRTADQAEIERHYREWIETFGRPR